MTEKHLYLLPGLGAQSAIYERIRWPESWQVTHLEWMEPLPNESLSAYAKRWVAQIDCPKPILMGVSLGGMVAQEMALHCQAECVILLSSVQDPAHMGRWLKTLKYTQFYRLTPYLIALLPHPFLQILMAGRMKLNHQKWFNRYMRQRSFRYLSWALNVVFTWQQKDVNCPVYAIKGDRDIIFPLQPHEIVLPKAGHLAILTHAPLISSLLPKLMADHEKSRNA
jgi:pimeloyl-ACP methyl ester carboxylesterase